MRMEYIMMLGLLIIIVLLLYDRYTATGSTVQGEDAKPPELPDIMGKAKSQRQPLQIDDTAGHTQDGSSEDTNFTDEHYGNQAEDPQEGPERAMGSIPDLEEEEEEFMAYGMEGSAAGFATGVTFEELSAAGIAIAGQGPAASMLQAEATVHKIDGTDLLTLLESALGDSSRKLAILLDRKTSRPEPGPSIARDNDEGDFSIEDFL